MTGRSGSGGARPDGGGLAPRRRCPRRTVGGALGVAVVAAAIWAGTSAPVVAAEGGAVVAVDQLNLRAEPGAWAAVVATMWSGEWVALGAGPTADGWYEVAYGDLTGWAFGAHLTIDGAAAWVDPADQWVEPAPAAAVGGAIGTAWVAIDSVNVRSWAGTDAALLGEIGYGEPITLLGGDNGGFVPIAYGDGLAWVWRDYLSLEGPPGPERWLDVDRSSGLVTLYEGDVQIASYWGAMGFDQSDSGFYATANGTFYVYEEYDALSWTNWGRAWVRDWVAYDPARLNGFHSYSMNERGETIPGGDGPTGGCVALSPAAADHVSDFVRLGSRVEVHW